MKYSININQKAIIDMDLNIDIIDMAIYDCVVSFMFTDKCRKIEVGGVIYYWVSSTFIIQELPLVGITTERGISKRIDKLIDCGLLERCPCNQSLKGTFYKVGKRYKEYTFGTWNECSNLTWNECSNNNNTIEYNNIIKEIEDKSSTKKEESDFIERMYSMYPTRCPKRNAFLGKTRKDKERIRKLLKVYSMDEIERVFKHEIEEKYEKQYMQNFSTFLNNFPDPKNLESKKVEENKSLDGMVNERGEIWSEQLQKWLK